MSKLATGLIYTNDKCVGCNKCIGVCSCHGATIAAESNEGKNIIVVDGSKCVGCGACLDSCEHNAREYVDDTLSFFDDLKRGEDISILVAPAFFANYNDEAREILGKLKALGVNRMISVGFGADITTWAYLNYISKNDFIGAISQPCPAVVDYIEKYIPELIPKLIPVQSPMMCAAIYARKKMNITGKLAFISPCIAKKNEIISERGKGLISYNVTFNHMMKYLRLQKCESVPFDEELECGLGSIYPKPGGLKENIYWFLGEDAFVRQVDGEKRMYEFLMENKSRILEKNSPYTMIDALNCSEGCLCGTGVESDIISKEDVLVQMMHIKKASKNIKSNDAWSGNLSPKQRLKELNKQFSDLDLQDYLCSYTDKSDKEAWKNPSEKELDAIFEDMNKSTEEARVINCSSCGYKSCKDMARAIYNGYNHKENCVHFLKDVLSGISADYPTVLLIHGRRQTVHIVKYDGEDSIKSWIDSGLSLIDYDTAILDYIERYVDDVDKRRVWKNVEFSKLLKNMEGTNRYAITYLRHPEIGESGYFELNFTREEGLNDIILSFKDVNKAVLEQQENQQNLENALRDAEQANITKSTFLANMSHEIRTPINAILGMDTMILRESNQENIIEYARNVKSASDTLLSLINDILDFSKIESGKMEIVEGKYRLDSVINDLMNMVGSKAEEKGLQLELDMEDNIPAQLHGDEVRIKQIALNLLNNAVKYTKEGKVILKFSYSQIDKDEISLFVAVKDTGIGIRQEDMKILFSPYERLEENKNKLIEGTGLGLSITKNLLEKMDSDLLVESVYGEGSEFSFKIRQKMWGPDRISKSSISTNASEFAEEECEAYHAPDAKILVVDDVEMNIMVVVNLLKRLHIRPDSCLSGREALEFTSMKKYDIIFLDAMMPGMNGEETLIEIRKNCTLNAETPIIVLTANAIIGAREQYIKEGFNDYLSKPIDGPKLEKMIHDYLPSERIIDISVGEDDELGAVSEEDKKVFEAIDKSRIISAQNGMQAAGDLATYINVCKNFLDTSGARIEMIRDFYDKKDASNYTIQVHALKSSARLVGAIELSEMALGLEMAGRDKNWEKIDTETSVLLGKYKEISGILDAAFAKLDDGKEKKELSEKKFDRRIGELLELVEAFDFESAKALFAEFDDYLIPEDRIMTYCILKSLIADVNRDEIINVITKQLER